MPATRRSLTGVQDVGLVVYQRLSVAPTAFDNVSFFVRRVDVEQVVQERPPYDLAMFKSESTVSLACRRRLQ